MKNTSPVAVTSRSFSKHPILRAEMLKRYERVTFNDEGKSLQGGELAAFLRGHAFAITALERIDDALLSQLPELKAIGKVGVGLDMLDLDAMDRRGVLLGWQGGTNRRSVSELTLGLLLALLRHVVPAAQGLRGGTWKQLKGTCLSGKTVGLLGLGHVGRDLALLLRPFGCRLLAFDKLEDRAFTEAHAVQMADLETLLREADIVSLHLSCTDETRGIIGPRTLGWMKKGAYLVNTARGGLVDEQALKEALKSGRLAGAALDVFSEEPPRDAELLGLPNVLPTPHIAGSTEEAIIAMGMAAIDGLENPRPAREFKAPA